MEYICIVLIYILTKILQIGITQINAIIIVVCVVYVIIDY